MTMLLFACIAGVLLGQALPVGTPSFKGPMIPGLRWNEIHGKDVEGRLFKDGLESEFDRVPLSFREKLPGLWEHGRSPSGMCFEFESDTTAVAVRLSLGLSAFGEANFNSTAFAGVDLYVMDGGRWRWAAATHHTDRWAREMEYGLLWNLPTGKRRYRMYLPMRNRLTAISVGVDENAAFTLAAPRAKPLVYYGTSLAHGAYQTRAGLGVPQILGRTLGVPVANFAFSGSARCEREVAELLAPVEASMFVLDPYHNMTVERSRTNLLEFCSLLCETHPLTPVVLLGAPHLANGWLWPEIAAECREKTSLFEKAGRELAAKYVNFRYIDGRNFYDGGVSPDGIHANDAAFDHMARMLRPMLRKQLLDTGAIRPRYPNGALLLTFDDAHYPRWERAMPLFAKYRAHATFFPCGDFGTNGIAVLRKLHEAGHSVGIHSLTHADMPDAFAKFGADTAFERQFEPQIRKLAEVGIHPTSIAYPNNRHNAATDEYLVRRGFRHFRAGHVVRHDPGHQHPAVEWATTDEVFFPADDLVNHIVLEGVGVGDCYRTDIDDICRAIRRAAANGEALVTFSHDIAEKANGISMKTEWLERILKTAAECGMPVIGFDEIPTAEEIAAERMLPGEPCFKPALPPDPFPDRISAFVWRNWFCVPLERMARTVGAKPEELSAIAAEMGLPPQPEILPEWRRRGYITVLRRNWHLLPYGQLTTLLDMTRDELAFSLKEDDFLFGKMGLLKPKCGELKWNGEEAGNRRDARRRIAAILKEEGVDDFTEEPRFEFVKRIAKAEPGFVPRAGSAGQAFDFRMVSSYFADYGDPLADPEIGSFPEGLLQKLSAEGVNAVWMHVILNTLVKDPKYPEFGIGSERRIANLKKLVERGRKYGIRVFLYMNEPRCQPHEFFDRPGREEIRGFRSPRAYGVTAMCTSTPEVRRWLHDSMRTLFSEVKGLGGIFTITMSENLTNCASHREKDKCPRCAKRTVGEILAEVNRVMVEGMSEGDPEATAIVWNWSWPVEEEEYIVSHLPKHNCRVMAVSEKDILVKRGGAEIPLSDYSISVVGPGEKAKAFWTRGRAAGLPVVAKVQAACSWELAAFPYIPAMDCVAEHARNLVREGVDGAMLSWSCGSAPVMNLSVYRDFRRGETSVDTVLDRIAAENYGEKAVPAIRKAWTAFSDGFREFPFDVVVAYKGPQQWGPANPLYAKPTGYQATMVGLPYDGLAFGTWDNRWIGRYPVEGWLGQFDRVAAGFERGVGLFEAALPLVDDAHRAEAEKDARMFRAEQLHFRSCTDQARFILARDRGDREGMRRHVLRELEAAKTLLPIARADSRIGYECSNHYFYIPQDLREKIILCRRLLSTGNYSR